MRDNGIGSWTTRRARMDPNGVAFVERGRSVTYLQIHQRAERIARVIRARGVVAGDRVAYLGYNSTDFIATMFATAKLGAVTVPLNTRLAAPETAYILQDSAPSLFIWTEPFASIVASPDITTLGLQTLRVEPGDGESLSELARLGENESDNNDNAGATGARVATSDGPVELTDLFMIQYTSGTSGRPKGVQLTHGNITWNVYNLLVDVDIRSDERSLVVAPLFHTAALNQILFPTFLKGGTSYIEASFDPAASLQLIESEKITTLFGVTSMYLSLRQQPAWESTDLSSLRSALSGGAPLPVPLLESYLDRGLMIIQGYGLTESSPGATMLRAADGVRKVGSAGSACFFSDTRLVDPTGADVTVGQIGEILVQGPNVTPGYWHQPAATQAAFTDGWLHTGDLGRRDDEGYLYVVDRVKDMIISGGENIYPAEVEQAIHAHPDVAECAVIGVPDEKWGEVGRAVVVPRSGTALTDEDVLTHLDGRIARYKIPKTVVIVDELPHNASGKLAKTRVREEFGTTNAQETP